MIIIGEKLNSSIKKTYKAMENSDAEFISETAAAQYDTGADYIDLNAALFLEKEAEKLKWLIKTAARPEGKVVLDSPNADAIAEVLREIPLQDVILNSTTLQESRYKSFLPLLKQYNAGVIALPIDDNGMPGNAQERLAIAERLIKSLLDDGVPPEKIYIDALAEAAAVGDGPKYALEAIRLIREKYADIHIICGLSNVSFGLPGRKAINAAFLSAAVCNGLDSAIIDVTDSLIMHVLYAAELISGKDEYCSRYIGYCKERGVI
jgi:cobalamin-dependent methionine synthase I